MELILALGCLLSELGHEHLVAFAQDRALTLQADSLEVDQEGHVWVSLTLAYNKQDAGEFLARYCPDNVVIDKWNLPWSGPRQSSIEVSGIPDRYRVQAVYYLSVSYGYDLLGRDNTVTLNDGGKVSGKIWISNRFNDEFRALKEIPELNLFISAKTTYEKTSKSNVPNWVQEHFGAYHLAGGFEPKPTARTVTFKRVAVPSKPAEQSNPQDKQKTTKIPQTRPSLATDH